MKLLVAAIALSLVSEAHATCAISFEAVDELGRPLPTMRVRLESETCQYKSELRVADEHGRGHIDGVPSDCQITARGDFRGCIIEPVSSSCNAPDVPLRLVCVEPRHVSLITVLATPEAFDG